jgi:hypothetical protein
MNYGNYSLTVDHRLDDEDIFEYDKDYFMVKPYVYITGGRNTETGEVYKKNDCYKLYANHDMPKR